MSYITALGTANPPNRFRQSDIADFMLRAMRLDNGESRKLQTIFRASGIEYRHSVLDDYGKTAGFTFYPDNADLAPFPGTEKRLRVFREHAFELSIRSTHDMLQRHPNVEMKEVTHLIVVCCTGMYAPGLDIDLVNALGLSPTIQRTAINFMGCHAAFTALKLADAICSSDNKASVLVVCTELCSIHFQREGSDDNMLANALFADGSASLIVRAQPKGSLRLRMESFHNDLATGGLADMAWTIGDVGFEMKLSAYVPDLIRNGISGFMQALLGKTGVTLSDIRYFAIHPGGKRILQVIEEELQISREDNDAAHRVLRNYGNMSSPTILFVLKEVIGRLNGQSTGQRILGLAFGPGLTLESMILTIEGH